MREVRGDDTLAIPQQIIFSGSSIEAPESPKAGSADAEVIRELIACSGLVTGSVTDLRRVFIERCSPQGSNKDRTKLSMKFLRALTKLQEAGIVELSGSGKDQTWALC
jgi:hypothetical protein